MDSETSDGPPRAVLIAAIVVAVGAIIAILVFAVLRQSPPPGQQPVAIASAPAPKADSTQCRTLLDALPEQLGDYRRAPAVEPAPAGAAAWQASPDTEPVVLRCGVDRPAEFVVGTPLQVVDTVAWFRVADGERSTWFAVDRAVYVALTSPPGSGPTPIQEISEVLAKALPAKQIDPAPAR